MGDKSTHIIPEAGDNISLVKWSRGVRELFEGCVIEGMVPSDGGGLNVDISAGKFYLAGAAFTYNGGTLPLTPSVTQYLYAVVDAVIDPTTLRFVQLDGQLIVSTTAPPSNDYYMLLATITTDGSGITVLTIATAPYTMVPAVDLPFLNLSDTPSSYSGQTLKGVRVNAGETALEFFTVPGAGSKHLFFGTTFNTTYNNEPVRSILTGGNFRWPFEIPDDFSSLVVAHIHVTPTAGAAGSGKDIDLYSNYSASGEDSTLHQENDTTSTYQLGSVADERGDLDVSGVLTGIAAGDRGGVLVDHQSIGGTAYYTLLHIEYVPT